MMTLTPAYGRDYTSKAKVLADLKAGKDFIINDIQSRWDGSYINLEQITEPVMIRYQRLTKVFVYKP